MSHDSAPRISSEFNLRGHCCNLARTRARHLARRVRGQSGGEQNCDVISSVGIQGFVTGRVGRGELCFDVQRGVETGRPGLVVGELWVDVYRGVYRAYSGQRGCHENGDILSSAGCAWD